MSKKKQNKSSGESLNKNISQENSIDCNDKNQVEQIRKTNKTGEFLATMYDGYMDEDVGLTTQTNDLCAIMYMIHPEIFKTHKVDIKVDTKEMLGKTTITDNPNGLVTFVDDVDNKIFFEKFSIAT